MADSFWLIFGTSGQIAQLNLSMLSEELGLAKAPTVSVDSYIASILIPFIYTCIWAVDYLYQTLTIFSLFGIHIHVLIHTHTLTYTLSFSKSSTGVDWFILDTEPGAAVKIHKAVDYWAKHIVEQVRNMPAGGSGTRVRIDTLVCLSPTFSLSLSLSLSFFSRDVVTLSLRTEALPPRPPVVPPSPPPSLVRTDSPSISHSRQRHRHLPPYMKQLDQ